MVMWVLLVYCDLGINSLAEPISLNAYEWFEFSFPTKLVAIVRLNSLVYSTNYPQLGVEWLDSYLS